MLDLIFLPLHSLTSLVSNCLNLLFGTRGRSRRLKPFYKQEAGRGHAVGVWSWEGPKGAVQLQLDLAVYIGV